MKYLITSALPYANGPLHFGHLAGVYIPADIMTRHKRILGHEALHISGSDEHGVAIMLNAKKEGKEYKEYVDGWHREHKALFEKFKIDFSYFGQTSSDYHQEEVTKWFSNLHEKGLIGPKDSQQLYCNDCKNHLPDRFVEGTCYECGYEEARGDECPKCGIWIEPEKLKNPVCKICGSKSIKEVTVTQYYLLMSKFHSEFRAWFESKKGLWRKTVYPFIDSLSKEELHDRAISRDLDWGIDIPLEGLDGKKLYVWFDAPIGYVSNLKQYLKENKIDEDYLADWWDNKDVTRINFIGKDNIIFHGIIFPMMSLASERARAVDDLPANQYLNLMGKQFSKSSGWYVDANKAVDDFGVDALRYSLVSILPEFSDSSFTWEIMAAKVNNELANNIGNLVNRCLKFWAKNWKDGIDSTLFDGYNSLEVSKTFKDGIKEYHELLDEYQIKKGLEKLMQLGSEANTFFSDLAPWAQFKEDPEAAAKTIAHSGINIMILAVLLEPYLPDLSSNILSYYGDLVTDELKQSLYKGKLEVIDSLFKGSVALTGKPSALVPKIDEKLIEELSAQLQN